MFAFGFTLVAEGLTAIFESGKAFGQWLSGLFRKRLKYGKESYHFALKLFIASALLGILAGFLGVKPLGINQEQVNSALFSIFFGLGLITAILTFLFH